MFFYLLYSRAKINNYNLFVSLYNSFPKEELQRQEWIKILKNAGKTGNWDGHLKYAKICGLHFKAEEVVNIRKGKNKRDHLLPTENLLKGSEVSVSII